nr:MAG TPA: hypothetical protein [Caudoviricetes sp.]
MTLWQAPALAVCGWPGFGLSGCDSVYSSDVVPSVGHLATSLPSMLSVICHRKTHPTAKVVDGCVFCV